MKYEVALMMIPSLSEEEANKAFSSVQETVSGLGGKVDKADFWGKKRMAYEVKRMQDAYYGSFEFESPAQVMIKVSSKLASQSEIFRYLVVKKG